MNDARLETIEHMRQFLAGTTDVAFGTPPDESSLQTCVATVLKRGDYCHLSKGQRAVLFTYLQRVTCPYVEAIMESTNPGRHRFARTCHARQPE